MTEVRIADHVTGEPGPWAELLSVVSRCAEPGLMVIVRSTGPYRLIEWWPVLGRRVEIRGNGITSMEVS